MNNMKSTFLFLLTTTMMTCTAYGQSSNHKENKLPDWAFGGFERPKNVNPVISPIENTKFYCPLTKDSIAWESNPPRLCHFYRRHTFPTGKDSCILSG